MQRRTRHLMVWPVFTGLLIAAFWAIYWSVAGSIPETRHLFWNMELISSGMNSSMSRLWDIAIGPIYSVLVIYFFTCKGIRSNDGSLKDSMVIGLIFGSIIAILVWLTGFTAIVPIITIAISFGFFLFCIFGVPIRMVFGCSFGFFISIGVVIGLANGVGFGMSLGIFSLAVILIPSFAGMGVHKLFVFLNKN